MPTNARVFSVFVAGAGDVANEHAIVRQLVEEWNRLHGSRLNAYVTVTGWKTDAYPAAGAEPQAIINRQILNAADVIIGIFWTRFGTPTATAGSGTEEEIERSIAAGKPTMVYFSDAPVAPSAFDAAEYAKVAAFKEKYSHRGLYTTYRNLTSFREEFRAHFAFLMNDLCGGSSPATSAAGSEAAAGGEPTISMSFVSGYWVVILRAVEMVMQSSVAKIAELRSRGVRLEEISDAETTALVAPIMIRGFIIDVLVKHGVLRPEAGATMGYDALMKTVRDTEVLGRQRAKEPPEES